MGTLKDRLNDDLHTAMKARDELTTATLRMALSAVRNAEVAGTEARALTDDEVGIGGGQFGDPALFAVLVGRQVQVRDVQDAHRLRVRLQDRYVAAAQGEQVALDQRGVGEGGSPGGGHAGGQGDKGALAHDGKSSLTDHGNAERPPER